MVSVTGSYHLPPPAISNGSIPETLKLLDNLNVWLISTGPTLETSLNPSVTYAGSPFSSTTAQDTGTDGISELTFAQSVRSVGLIYEFANA